MKTIKLDVNAILKTAPILGDDETRQQLMYHTFEKDKTISCSGRALMIHKAKNDDSIKKIAIKLPVKMIKKFCTRCNSVIVEYIEFEYDDEGSSEGTGNLCLPGVKIQCEYSSTYVLQYKRMLRDFKDVKPCYFRVNPQLFALFGDCVNVMATSEKEPIYITPGTGNDFVGLIMPMRGDIDVEKQTILTYCNVMNVPVVVMSESKENIVSE